MKTRHTEEKCMDSQADDAMMARPLVRTLVHTVSGGMGTVLMAIATPNTSTTATAPGTGQSYGAPLATVTTLFFMWGFLTCLNDILVPHLKSIFDLNYAKSMLIQFAFFGAYFIFSIPSAKLVDWMGYQQVDGRGSAHDGTVGHSCSCRPRVFRRFRYFWAR